MTSPVPRTVDELILWVARLHISEQKKRELVERWGLIEKQAFFKQDGQTTTLTPPLHPGCRCAMGLEFIEPDTETV